MENLKCSHPQEGSEISREVLMSRESPILNLQHGANSLNFGKPSATKSSDQQGPVSGNANKGASPAPMRLKNYQKPWPSRKSSASQELVKHMSNVPNYLQHVDGEENVQGRALNVGVLDWGRLEKWSYEQKNMASRKIESSPTSICRSSPYSTSGSSTISDRCTNSPSYQCRQSPSRTRLLAGRRHSVDASYTHEKSRAYEKESKVTFYDGNGSQCDPYAQQHGNLSSGGDKEKTHNYEWNKVPQISGLWNHLDDANMSRALCVEECLALTENIEGMWEHLQENGHRRNSSFEFRTIKDEIPKAVNRSSFSRNTTPEEIRASGLYIHLPHSGPLPSTTDCGYADAHDTSPFENNPKNALRRANPQSRSLRGVAYELSDFPWDDSLVAYGMTTNNISKKGLSPTRKSSVGLTWMGRSTSMREDSPKRQIKVSQSSNNLTGDTSNVNTKGRRSPLRRILDPLLKPKNRNVSVQPIDANAHDLKENDKHPTQVQTVSNRAACNMPNGDANTFSKPQDPIQEENLKESTKHALLQLAWRNGLPLFMLSSNDSDILAATIRKGDTFMKDKQECVYDILFVREVKKKGSIWMNHVNKNKTQGLASNVVGQLKVSSSSLLDHDTHNYFMTREFVLYGTGLTAASNETVISRLSSELAAIVVKSQYGKMDFNHKNAAVQNSGKDTSTDQAGSLKVERPASSDLCNFSAVLPSAVHGLSAEGEPSSLIKRWKSGGSCDCGGWDEGCRITVLCHNFLENDCSYNSQHIELFKVGCKEKKPVFSMTPFKEGLYTIEFESSIALLQAFTICIAKLHDSRHPNQLELLPRLVEAKCREELSSVADDGTAKTLIEDASSYMPNCPPSSPVGRA